MIKYNHNSSLNEYLNEIYNKNGSLSDLFRNRKKRITKSIDRNILKEEFDLKKIIINHR